jgi:transposase InsO family protein
LSPSHKCTSLPSPLLCLVALGIVARLRPAWLAVDVGEAARAEAQSPERVSRLVSRAIAPFEAALATLTRRGRPPRAREADARDAELAMTRELLAVASGVLEAVSKRGLVVRDRIVGAWRRLEASPGMTQARFCDALGLSVRTLRSWLTTPPRPRRPSPPVPPGPKPPRSRPPRRRRFSFDVTLPDVLIGADTTDLSTFGVSLKLVAAQDVGGRDTSLFDAIVVDDRESAEHVVRVLEELLRGKPGAQVITDQGTPYMAARTKQALDELAVEHAPQREGDPCGKSTVERAFRSLKDVARPLLALTDRLADAVPALRDGDLAKAAATVVLTALLRAYQHGARAARAAIDARGGLDADTLADLAEQTRERARATEQSARLLLAHVHELYGLGGSQRSFVDSLRIYPLSVLRDAEKAMRAQAHRDDIRDRRSYFAAVVRKLHDEHKCMSKRDRREREEHTLRERDRREHDARLAAWRAEPARALRDALDLVAMQWVPKQSVLFAGGAGFGLGLAQRAIARLTELHGLTAAADVIRGVLATWRIANLDRLGRDGLDAVEHVIVRGLADATPDTTARCPVSATSATLPLAGRFSRPPPSERLRN